MTNNNMKQYEIQEAKKRMGTYSGNTNSVGTGMTSSTGSYTNTTGHGRLKTSEEAQAEVRMHTNNMMY